MRSLVHTLAKSISVSTAGCALACLVACASMPQAQVPSGTVPRRPTTHEDVWTMRRLGTPALSPDGTRAVFSVTEPSYDPDETRTDLWVVATDGSGAPRRLTATSGGEGGVTWSPDGTRIAFTAKREGDSKSQVYVLPMDGPGEAVCVTDCEAGASNPQWSPDGERLAYETLVESPRPTEVEMEEEVGASAYETFPVRYWDRWLDRRQPRIVVQYVADPDSATDLLDGCDLVMERGFSGSPGRGRDSLSAVWSPDGASIFFVATTERDKSAYADVRYRIYRVDANEEPGEPTLVTDDERASESGPWFEPGDARLFYMRRPLSEFVYGHAHVMARDLGAGASKRLVSAFDRPVDDVVIRGDSLWCVATEHGRRRVFRGATSAGAPQLTDPESRGVYAGLTASNDGSVVVAKWEDSTHPAEIVRVDAATGRHTSLTAFNKARADELDRQPFREFWFESEKGRRIHCWMVLPPGFEESAKYPVLTWMHGGPHSSSMDADHVRWSPHLMAAPGYVVLLIDYTGSVGYGEEFARAIQGDPLQTPGDELLQAARVAAERFSFVDSTRQAALGASYGGHLANWMQARTDHFRCLVGHAGLISLEGQWSTSDVIYHRERNNGGAPWEGSPVWQEQSPATYASAFRTPMMLTIGEKDYRVPLNQTLAAWSYLQRQKVPSRLVVFHDANHWVMRGADARYYWREVHAWLARYLGD